MGWSGAGVGGRMEGGGVRIGMGGGGGWRVGEEGRRREVEGGKECCDRVANHRYTINQTTSRNFYL